MSDKQIQVLLALPSVDVDEIEGVATVSDLLKLLAKQHDSEGWKLEAAVHKQSIHSFGKSLELILNEVDNPFEKAQALRKLVEDMKGYDG